MIKSQFSYCPLIWMFSSRQSNNQISKFMKDHLGLLQMMKIIVLKL